MGAIMKKNLIISTLVLAAMCSCTKNDALLPENPQKEISFNAPVVSNITKAVTGEIIEYDTEESFGVFSVYHEDGFSGWEDNASPYINGAEFSYDDSAKDGDSYVDKSGGWTGGYLFPKVGSLSFAAYSPFDAHSSASTVPAGKGNFSYGNTGLAIDDFSVPASPADQYDLMYSNRLYNRTVNMGSQTGYEGMDITFFHALSSIRFTAQLDSPYTSTFTLTSVTINGVEYSGDFCENVLNPKTASYKSEPYWIVDYTDTGDKATTSYTAFNGEYVMTQTQTQVNAYDIILMPQEFIFKNENGEVVGYSDAEIVIEYTVNESTQSSTVKLSDLKIKEWEMGKRYTYNITLGYDLILVGATVEKWEDGNTDDIPIN